MTEHVLTGRRLGRRKPDRSRPVLNALDFLTGYIPPVPLVDNHLDAVAAWNGQTNINFGTCGPCGLANTAIMVWEYLLGQEILVTDDAVYDLYRRSGNPDFDPDVPPDANGNVPGDNGVDLSVMLAEAAKNGFTITHVPSGETEVVRPVAFAAIPLGHGGITYVHDVTALMGGALLGVDLEQAQQSQTDTGIWDYSPSPDWGGHAIFGGSYTSSLAAHTADESVISWMQKVGLTDAFFNHQDSEAYAVIFEAHLDHPDFLAGVNLPMLAAAYQAITDRTFPAPVPAPVPPSPAPIPPPAPVPVPAPPAVDVQLAHWALTALPWSKLHHIGGNERMAQATATLLSQKGIS